MAVCFHMSDLRLDGGAPRELAFDAAEDPAFLAGDEDAARVWGIVAAVSLVDIGTLDLAAGEPLSGFDDGAQRVAVIRIAGQRPGVQNKLTTRCPGIGGDDGSFHTEFVRRAGLAPADATTSGAWKEYSFQPRWRCCCERI